MPVGAILHIAEQPELPPYLDVGYTVLLDKDSITAGLQPPTYSAYVLAPPGEETYYQVVEEFFHESTYVAKNLWRDELLPWKYSLDQVMKTKKLRRMLEWHVETEQDWTVETGVLGKGLKKYLRPDLWEGLEQTYVGTGVEENWEALFRTIDLFRRVAIEVGERLGYDYPRDLDRRVVAYLREVRAV
jgi:aminoglycoside 6-adenylyltransferase